MPDVAERTLPHNLEAERVVLGAVLMRNDALAVAASIIDSEDFFRDAHRRVFDKMIALQERGDAIDLVTLKNELSRSGELDEVGGPAYLAALLDGVPHSSNVDHYAGIVKEKAMLRGLIFASSKIIAQAYEAEHDASTLINVASGQLFTLAEARERKAMFSLRDLSTGALDAIEALSAEQRTVTGVSTGFTDIDEMMSGLQPADLIIVAARPSMGKTSLALNIAQHVGTTTKMVVGFFSLEMSKEQLFMRLLTSEARIDAHRMRGGFLGERDWARLSVALGALTEASVFVDDSSASSVFDVRAKCRQLKAEHGLHLVIVDYLQLMRGAGRFENRTLELASISRALKGLAKELHVPVVALSQLSRASETRADRRPRLSDLRESGALEQDADVVMFIYRDDAPETKGVAEVIIAKQRNGPTGMAKLAFITEYTRFEDLARVGTDGQV